MADAVERRTVVTGDGCSVGVELRTPAPGHLADDGTVVVLLPALGVPLGYYDRLLDLWAARGRTVLGVEHRGMPSGPADQVRRGRSGWSAVVHHDLPAAFSVDEVRAARRVVLVGHSMGGVVALLAAASGTVAPTAVVTVATGTSRWTALSGIGPRARRAAAVAVVRTTTGVLGWWPGHRLGFIGRQPAPMMLDWSYEAVHGRFVLLGDDVDHEAALARSRVPTLMLGIAGDVWIPSRAVALLHRRASPSATHLDLPPVPGRPTGHLNWVRRTPDHVVDAVERWLGAWPAQDGVST